MAGIVAIASLLFTVSACSSGKHPDPRVEAPLVQVAVAQRAGASARAFTGSVAARVQSGLGFRVSGKVTERLVDAGQLVHQGQPLMRLDRTDFSHSAISQRGAVAAARARMVQTSADEERYRGLVASGAVSQSQYDQIKAAADSARASLESLEAQLRVAKDDERYTTLVADRDGTLMDTLAEPGQFVVAGQIVLKVAYSGPREAVVYLPETLRPKSGSAATVVLHGGDPRTSPHYAAHLRQLSDSADQGSRTFEARYVLDGVAGTAPLGATVTVFIDEPAEGDTVEVPLGAVEDEGDGPGIWVLDPKASAVTYRQVKLLRFAGEGAIVSGSVKQGDRIVALGGHFLRQGQQVRVADRVLGTE